MYIQLIAEGLQLKSVKQTGFWVRVLHIWSALFGVLVWLLIVHPTSVEKLALKLVKWSTQSNVKRGWCVGIIGKGFENRIIGKTSSPVVSTLLVRTSITLVYGLANVFSCTCNSRMCVFGKLTFGTNTKTRKTVVAIITPPSNRISFSTYRVLRANVIIPKMTMMVVDVYTMITISFESFSTFIFTFLVMMARMNAATCSEKR